MHLRNSRVSLTNIAYFLPSLRIDDSGQTMAYWILMLCLFKRTFLKQLPYRLKTALLTTDMATRKPEGLNKVPAAIFFCVVFCLLIVNCLKLWLLFCRCDITIATRESSRDALRQRCFLRVSKICWVVHVLLGCVICAFIIVPLEQINLLPWISFSSPSLESVDERMIYPWSIYANSQWEHGGK